MIFYGCFVLLLLLGGVTISIFTKKKIGFGLFGYLLLTIFFLYSGGFFLSLKVVSWIWVGFTVIASIGAWINLVHQPNWKQFSKTHLVTSSLFFFLLFAGLIYGINRGKIMTDIDEYTHWADVVKHMVQTQHLSFQSPEGLLYPSYPPAISLLQSFAMFLRGSFQEELLYLVYQLFGWCCFLPIVDRLAVPKQKWVLGILLFLLPFLFFPNYYQSLYVDALLGMVFASLVLFLFYHDDLDLFDLMFLCLGMVTLTLLKSVGLFFSLVLWFLYTFWYQKREKKVSVLFLLVILFALASWQGALFYHQVPLQHQNSFSLLTLFDSSFTHQISSKFIEQLTTHSILTKPLSLNYFSILIVFCGLYFYFGSKQKRERNGFFFLVFGALLYLGGLYFTYLTQFSLKEALSLLSWDRYIVIFLNGLFYIFIFLLLKQIQKKSHLWMLLGILCCFIPQYPVVMVWKHATKTPEIEAVEQLSKNHRQQTIYVFDQNADRYRFAYYHYWLRPNLLTMTKSDVYYTNQLEEKMNEYDYLYLVSVSDKTKQQLQERYQITVDINTLYRIKGQQLIPSN